MSKTPDQTNSHLIKLVQTTFPDHTRLEKIRKNKVLNKLD